MTSAKTHFQTAREFHDLNMGFAVSTRLSTNQKRLQTAMCIDIYARIHLYIDTAIIYGTKHHHFSNLQKQYLFCLTALWFSVPVNNFSAKSGWSLTSWLLTRAQLFKTVVQNFLSLTVSLFFVEKM